MITLDFFETFIGKIISSGAVVNFFLVILGAIIGLIAKKGIPKRVKTTLMHGMALCVIYIGITGLFEEQANIIVIIISFALGSFLGELANFDKIINDFGEKLEKKFSNGETKIAQGFVTATLLFCVGAMTVVGSIESGINGDNATLYSKGIIDCVAGAALTSSLGIGVLFACVPVLLIEGGLTLLATAVSPILTSIAVAQMSVIGSCLIIALGFNMLGITKIKVMNYLPSIFLPIVFYLFL